MSADRVPDMWVNTDPSLTFEDASLASLVAYWASKCGDRAMPPRSAIVPAEIRQHMGSLCLIEVEHAPLRLRYRLIGTKVAQAMGRDATGRYYDEIYPPELLNNILASFRWLIEHRRPLRSFGRAFYPDRNFYDYEIVNLPLSEDGTTMNMVLGKLVFHRRTALPR